MRHKLGELYEEFPRIMAQLETWSLYLSPTSLTDLEEISVNRLPGYPATRRRKLYNGRIECNYFQYLVSRPPKGYFDDKEGDETETAS